MKVERITVKSNCKICQESITFRLDRPLSKDLLSIFSNNGFQELPQFTKRGLLYMESKPMVIMGAFGQPLIQTKGKNKDYQKFVNDFEQLLISI